MGDALLLEQLVHQEGPICPAEDAPTAPVTVGQWHSSDRPSACTVMLWLAWVTDGDVNPAETQNCEIFVLGASKVLGMACLELVCLPPSCPSFPRSSQDRRKGGCMPPHPHGASRTSRLPHSKAKSTLHASNPIICYLQGQGPGWKPCPPLHPSSTKDHRAMWSLLWHGARRGQGPSWGSAQHPDPQDEVLKPLWHREAPTSRTTAVSPGGWRAAAQGQASWGYLPTSQQHPPTVKHQSHPGHLALMIFPSANTTYSSHPLGKLLQLRAAGKGEYQAGSVTLSP